MHALRFQTSTILLIWQAVSRRSQLIGITIRTKTSPNTWRWQQHGEWIHLLQKGTV